MTGPASAFAAEPYSYAEARVLASELKLSEPLAITLVRRGYRTPDEARQFLEATESHDPFDFAGMDEAVGLVLERISGGRITVHGDYDVDGVCATAILVGTLRRLGAECDWFIPDRQGDGYGLTGTTVDALSARGTKLLITVDCGITAVEPVAAARARGIDVLVTDHHQPDVALPDCPIVHPAHCGYPFEELCGTAVAWKLCGALLERSGRGAADAERDLDLVALATVADVVPLVGENRSLVRRGLEVARRGGRIGLRALMAVSGTAPERLDEGDLAFRIGPRINAAGRLYRADAGVELMLTEDERRAGAIADELDRANRERRDTERVVEQAAEAAFRDLPDRYRDAPALVLAGSGWHPGVVGIVASRMVERHWRPVVVVSFDGDGAGRGSGRSVPGFDLLAGLHCCAPHLERFGGHRAAAGLEVRAESLDAFREVFVAHAEEVLGQGESTRTERVDAIVGGTALGLDLAEDLRRLAPFGAGNPAVALLVPSAQLSDVRPMGEEGRHARFSLRSGGSSALGVVFGRSSLPGAEASLDAAVRLEVNEWNGAIEPRLVLRELYPLGEAAGGHCESCDCPEEEWWARLEAELSAALDGPPATAAASGRELVRDAGSTIAILAELVSSGEAVLGVCADASRRAGLALGPAGLARFGGAAPTIACARCGRDSAAAGLARREAGGLALTDYETLVRTPGAAARFAQVVLIDPPSAPTELSSASAPAGSGGYLHRAWGDGEEAFTRSVLGERLGLRAPLAAIFRALRDSPTEDLSEALRGPGPHQRSPELAGRCLRVLLELGLVERTADSLAGGLRVVSSERIDLGRSEAFQAYQRRHEEALAYLERQRQPSASQR